MKKVRIEVFVPLGSCVCSYAQIMERVGRAISEVKDFVEVQMKSTNSSEATKYGIQDSCVIVDGKIKLPSSFDEKELRNTILKRMHQDA